MAKNIVAPFFGHGVPEICPFSLVREQRMMYNAFTLLFLSRFVCFFFKRSLRK